MNRRILLQSFAAAAVARRANPQNTPPPPDLIEPKRMREDLDILHAALEEGHPGVHRYTKKADLDKAFVAASASLNKPAGPLEFFRVAAPAVAAVKCGHTRLRVPQTVADFVNKQLLQLPLDVRLFPDGKDAHALHVLNDFAFEGQYAGRQIVSINGVPSAKIVSVLMNALNADGNSPTGRIRRVEQSFQQMLYLIAGVNPPYQVAFLHPSRRGLEGAETPGLTQDKIEEIATKLPAFQRGEIGEFRFLVPKEVAYLKIRGFGRDKAEGKPLPEFMDAKFGEMAAAGTRSLVLDLRRNGGGADELARQLFAYLYDKPFRYYDALYLNKLQFDFMKYIPDARPLPAERVTKNKDGRYDWTSHPNWGEMKPGVPHFSGKTFVLIDGGSFSATCEFAAQAHFHQVATFVGEETAGAYTGNTSGMTAPLVLPNTKCRIGIPLCGYYMAVKTDRPDRGIFPDVPVAPTLDDLRAGRDPALDRAISLAKS